MLKKLLFLMLLLPWCSALFGEDNLQFDKANQLYHNKRFDSAAVLYEQMIRDGYCHADLYYNAGNAYYRINKIGLAIWCYEKALQSKEEKNYRDNLVLARKRIKEPILQVDDIFFIRWWKSMYQALSVNGWAIGAMVFFLIGIGLLFYRKFRAGLSTIFHRLMFSFSIVFLCFSLIRAYQDQYHYRAVVIVPETMFTSSLKAEPVMLSEGIVVEYEGISKTGILVKLPDGRKGSIDAKSIRKL
ncbi:MAG: hypothetical protein JNJ58_07225 [Chitinophagaceae bacterium]|nr:hypothetical protein [Chitinophagaceae bacterium]